MTADALANAAQRLLQQLGPYGPTFEGPHRRELQRAIDDYRETTERMTTINTPDGPAPEPAPWREQLDARELAELTFAEEYMLRFRHGTDGHGRLLLIAKLGQLLDVATAANEDLRRRLSAPGAGFAAERAASQGEEQG